ncbi:MAG: ribonuclease HI family protein [bacterium]|nr:ribonuclease HI family protein [bacterium]
MENEISIYCDGGSRGNPGPAASAFVVFGGSEIVHQSGKEIGITTNNVAEYSAVILALEWLKTQKLFSPSSINFFLDSELVAKQLTGHYRIKNAKLKILAVKVKSLEKEIGKNIFYRIIPRGKNSLADALVNEALDKTL